jgi:hypothetical protein
MDYVFWAVGHNVESFIVQKEELVFSSKKYTEKEQFLLGKEKKVTLSTFFSIRFNCIKFIKKEENASNIVIKYKGWFGLPSQLEIEMEVISDIEMFFELLIVDKNFTQTIKEQTSFKAIKNYAIGLAATIAATVFCYYQSIAIKQNGIKLTGGAKQRLFEILMDKLGPFWVVNFGVLGVCYILYKIWLRFKKPPKQILLIPKIEQ